MLNINILAMDVDGTMTDGKINISASGELFKSFNVQDGMGIMKLIDSGIIPVIITGRYSTIVEERARELKIKDVYQNQNNKEFAIRDVARKYGVNLSSIVYIGDDENDLGAIKIVGISFAPSNAVDEVKKQVSMVLSKAGGDGAIRECVDYLLSHY